MSRVLVIGGGAAGMFAAIQAGAKGHQVQLFEQKERLGKKLFLTGKGRCNVTNVAEEEQLLQHVTDHPKFLYSAFYTWNSRRTMEFFEEAKVPLKVERGGRVFPRSDHSSEILRALEGKLRQQGVQIFCNSRVQRILAKKGQFQGIIVKCRGKERFVAGDACIIATGGLSYPSTGATGDGYRLAKMVGHTTTPLCPGLVPMEVKERELARQFMGVSLKNVRVTFREGRKICYEAFGEMIFTHYGVSGPVILSASNVLGNDFYPMGYRKKRENFLTLEIDLKPALSLEQLNARLLRDFEKAGKKELKNAVSGLFPARLIPVMIQQSGIAPTKRVNLITREERQRFAVAIKSISFTVTGFRGYEEAIITRGGIALKEIHASTMESKVTAGVFFAGEVLDLAAFTGGYNLQIAWSTAYLAANHIL